MPNRAIVVAIQAYPELRPALQGPVNDAKKFFDWVTTHGGVDGAAGDATLILGDDPPASAAVNARPTPEAIKYQFDLLEEEANHSPNGQAGDRLYLYLSGHGFGQDLSDASLLMANATQNRTRHHILAGSGRTISSCGYFKRCYCFWTVAANATRDNATTRLRLVPPATAPFWVRGSRCCRERNIDGRWEAFT